ncbi:autotransporter assembly complex protein TamA [Shimia ponticola]|uniref:autotransporter assembly complex protein TamA n=1 Tax=Shimia ponticola TaxID=2582893 RepID=UPI0011BFBC1E|nr:BamA/TamA family outer membrane protein [Shimia ponticola]
MRSSLVQYLASIALGLSMLGAGPALALETSLRVLGGDDDLRDALDAASAVRKLEDINETDPQTIVSAALSDYRNLTLALYSNGYYSGVVNVRVNGREAADIPLVNLPSNVRRVSFVIDPGRPFRFGQVDIAPLPADADLDLPQRGDRARSDDIQTSVDSAVEAWRDAGHAKVGVADQRATANHAARRLSVETRLAPGPRVVFGDLVLNSDSAVRAKQIRRIAGLPTGEVFSPQTLETAATRLERTGTFSSVVLSEADTLGPGNSLDIGVSVTDAKPRRFGFGAEVSTDEGLALSSFWLHRNYLGGAERLRLDGRVSGIGSTSGIDALAAARIDRPAVFGPDTNGFLFAEAERLDEPDFRSDRVTFGAGASRIYSPQFEAEVGVALNYSRTEDDLGDREFLFLSFPGSLTYDGRDDPLTPTSGYYLNAEGTPFLGLDDTASGMRAYADARGYFALDTDARIVLAGRLQFGTVFGAAIEDIHPDFLFYSGGSNTVRGQPFQSLNVALDGGGEIGGRSFAGASTEVRVALRDRLSAVAFYDIGYITDGDLWDTDGDSHSGAGLGVRYLTPIGPLRVDIGAPTGGDTGDGVQLYIGIGQAF